jgi:glutamate N-acetyltransferase/amino-acid N-acetyltransferase
MTIKGFRFAAVEAAIKKPGRLDLALLFSEQPAQVAAVFTTNKVKAAPVLLDEERVKGGSARAVVVNSGNANACTGAAGLADAKTTAALVAGGLAIREEEVLVASTGVIGVPLPMERLTAAVPGLVAAAGTASLADVAAAIMTTDTFPKMESRQGEAGGVPYTIAGVAKGAGMIRPDMATMLAFIVTDAAIEPQLLQQLFREANERSFNSITVDGDMSTNDTAIILANGAANNPPILPKTPAAESFAALLGDLLLALAKLIVKDGEGATKFVTITVKGAVSATEAKQAAMAVANSSLVKTAFFGQDANWGRIFAAVGYSGVQVEQLKTELFFDDVQMVRDGLFVGGDAEARGTAVLQKSEFAVVVDLHLGEGSATVYTSDLSYDYVKINADYRT